MKRAAIMIIVCAVIFFAVNKVLLIPQSRTPAPNTATASAPVVVLPPKPQPLVTSLPPLTNLTFRAQRPVIQPAQIKAPIDIKEPAFPTPPPKSSGKPPRQDLVARAALALVGIDSDAEQYWALAINDPSLSESEREDLIEDLNEEGFEDPKNPTVDELPLIVNRLQIIEEYAPSAMDEVNARSFAEAYKDLVNMYVRLTGQEPP